MVSSNSSGWRRSWEPRLKEWRFNLSRIRNNPMSLLGVGLILFNLVLASITPFITTPNKPNPFRVPKVFSNEPLPPSSDHPFGTSGPPSYYDVYYGVVWGSRMSIMISITVLVGSLTLGILIGTISGVLGGIIDEIIMRITDIFFALPGLVLAMAVASVLGRNITNLMLALTMTWWPGPARLIRSEVLKIKQEAYIEAAKSIGAGSLTVIFKHILPNAIFPVLIIGSMQFGSVVMMASALSFLGLGAEPGMAEWGIIISEGRNWILQGAWWTTFFPGIAIFIYVLGWNLLGDAFRDILDPRVRRSMI